MTKRYCQPGPLQIRNGKLFDADGAEFAIHGVNWFGLELGKGIFDGLNATDGFGNDLDSALLRNWKIVAARIKLLGFNTIRLTFSFSRLLPDVQHMQYSLDSTVDEPLQKQYRSVTPDAVRENLTNPDEAPLHDWGHTPISETTDLLAAIIGNEQPGQLYNNDLKPAAKDGAAFANVLDRFLDIVRTLVGIGFYVVLDCQLQQDALSQYYLTTQGISGGGPANWVKKWTDLMTEVYKLPDVNGVHVADYVIVDVLNEPDFSSIKWVPNGNIPGAKDLYLMAMHGISTLQGGGSTLFFVEGTDSRTNGINWGDHFASTDAGVRAFLDALLDSAFLSKVIISPHVYPPSVSTLGGPDYWLGSKTPAGPLPTGQPPPLYGWLDTLFGWLTMPYTRTSPASGRISSWNFPICIGETGAAFIKYPLPTPAANTGYPGSGPWSTVYKDPSGSNNITFEPQWDPLYMAALAAYFQARGIGNFIWWAWNSDGGDTGGIPANDSFFWQQGAAGSVHRVLPNNGVPWTDINWDKIMWMEQAFGLKPWYLQGGSIPVAAPATPVQKLMPPVARALTPPIATA